MAGTRDFREAVTTLWNEYQRRGPGRMPAVFLEAVEAAWQQLEGELGDWPSTAAAAAETALELSRRCVRHSQGLCFVTGEAGLVPRQHLHQAFEEALKSWP